MINVSEFNLDEQSGKVYVEYDNGTGVEKDLAHAITGKLDTATGKVILDDASRAAVMALPCVYNLKRSNMANWIAARDSVKAGGRPTAVMVGDSTFAGAGAGTAGTTAMVGAKQRNVETKLAQALKKLGIPARGGHFCGNNNVIGASGITYDGTAGTSYSTQLAYTGTAVWNQQTLGVLMLRLNATGEKASWTPTHSFDTITITYVRNAGLSSATVDVDGGASLGTINANGAGGVMTATFTCTEGTHTVNITNQANAQFYIRSIKCSSSSRGCVDILTAAHWGGLVADFNSTTNPWSPGNVMGVDGQKLTIVKLMTNDANGATSLATYQSGMETLIGRLKSAGSDVLLMSADPFNSANYNNGKAATFIACLRDTLAVNFDCPFIDLDSYFGPWGEQRVGYYYDSLHPAEALYAEEGDLIARVLAAV